MHQDRFFFAPKTLFLFKNLIKRKQIRSFIKELINEYKVASFIKKILAAHAASSTTVAKKNLVLLSFDMTTMGSMDASSSSSLLPEAVGSGSTLGATKAAALKAVSANLVME